jgi:lipid II:glycine glycyltransferase (peptidoglycan interpeptide bridge formation enzyme)
MVDIRQSIQYANYLGKIGWTVERLGEINYFIRKLPLVGSIIKLQRPEEIKIEKIRQLAKEYRAFQIIVEPKTELDAKYLFSLGFKLSKSPYLPTKTLQLDLTKSEKALFKNLAKDAKGAIRKNKNLEIKKSSPENLRLTWEKAVGIKRYIPSLNHLKALKKSFKNRALFLTHQDAGAIFLTVEGIAYYWQAFSGPVARKSLYQYKILWEGILWAKAKGARVFDFEGIFDERFPKKDWKGFSHFKKSFGGYEVDYPGTMLKSRLPF